MEDEECSGRPRAAAEVNVAAVRSLLEKERIYAIYAPYHSIYTLYSTPHATVYEFWQPTSFVRLKNEGHSIIQHRNTRSLVSPCLQYSSRC